MTTQACGSDWYCTAHGWICNLDLDHDGEHLCVYCPKPMAPGWSNAAKARAGDLDADEAAMRDAVETTPDVD